MIPASIESHLKNHHLSYQHHVHARAVPAQRLAAAEGVSGYQVAKTIVLNIDGELAIAVIAAAQRLDRDALEMALGTSDIQTAPEETFVDRFQPCEPGAEPPLCLFGLPIYVDATLAKEPSLMMRGGTHTDALQVITDAWIRAEQAVPIEGLGTP